MGEVGAYDKTSPDSSGIPSTGYSDILPDAPFSVPSTAFNCICILRMQIKLNTMVTPAFSVLKAVGQNWPVANEMPGQNVSIGWCNAVASLRTPAPSLRLHRLEETQRWDCSTRWCVLLYYFKEALRDDYYFLGGPKWAVLLCGALRGILILWRVRRGHYHYVGAL